MRFFFGIDLHQTSLKPFPSNLHCFSSLILIKKKACVSCIKQSLTDSEKMDKHALWITQRPLGYWVSTEKSTHFINWACLEAFCPIRVV